MSHFQPQRPYALRLNTFAYSDIQYNTESGLEASPGGGFSMGNSPSPKVCISLDLFTPYGRKTGSHTEKRSVENVENVDKSVDKKIMQPQKNRETQGFYRIRHIM